MTPDGIGITVGQAIAVVSAVGSILCGVVAALFGYLMSAMKQAAADCAARDATTRAELAKLSGEDRTVCLQAFLGNTAALKDNAEALKNCTQLLVETRAAVRDLQEETGRHAAPRG